MRIIKPETVHSIENSPAVVILPGRSEITKLISSRIKQRDCARRCAIIKQCPIFVGIDLTL